MPRQRARGSRGGRLRCLALVAAAGSHVCGALDFRPCLSSPAAAANLTVAGRERHLVVGSGNWDAPRVLGRVAQIILNEGVGIVTDFDDSFSGSEDMFHRMLGCANDACTALNDWPSVHFDFENWFNEAGEALRKANPGVLKGGFIGYDGQEGLYMLESTAQAAWDDHRLPLEYYVSLGHPERPWTRYFTNVSAIEIPAGSGCRGDVADKMAAEGMPCSADGWWYSPTCADDPDTCIPVIMGDFDWLGVETCHVINYNRIPVAVTFLDWPDARLQDGSVNALFKWWRPDWGYNALGPVRRLLFPKHNRQQWAEGLFITDFPDFQLKKYMWAGLAGLSEEASTMFDNFEVSWTQINKFMDQMHNRSGSGDPDLIFTIACEWVRANEATWRRWIAVDRTKCLVGQGLTTGDDGELSCQWCPSATFSDPHPTLPGSRLCVSCAEGEYQAVPGQSSCEPCAAGHFVGTQGNTACARCEIGRYASGRGANECAACSPGFSTQYPGATEEALCQCPEGFYRRASGRSACEACPAGMTCAWGSDAAAGAAVHPVLEPAYWSAPEEPLSVFACEGRERCPGGDPGACGPRLRGRSCAHCAEGWAWDGSACARCSSMETTRVLFPVLPCLLIPVAVIVLYRFFGDTYSKWGSWQNAVAALVFVVVNHYQVTALLRSTNVQFPVGVAAVYDFPLFSFGRDLSSLFRIECAGYSNIRLSLPLKAAFPGLVLLGAAATWMTSHLLALATKRSFLRMEKNRTTNAVLSLMFTFFAGIVAMAVSLFVCIPNPNGKQSLEADRAVICYESDWNDMLAVGICAVLLWCLGFGGLFLRAVLTSRHNFVNPHWQMRWKFLFIKFRPDVHWWSLVFIARGTLLNLSIVAFQTGVSQIYCIMWLLLVYEAMVVAFRPWRHMVINIADAVAQMCLIVSCSYLTWFGHNAPEVEAEALDRDIALLVILSAFLALPICVACGVYVYYTQTSARVQRRVELEGRAIRDACKRVAACPEDEYDRFVRALPEWDFWFLMSAKKVIYMELVQVACRSGYSTRRLSKQVPPLQEGPEEEPEELLGNEENPWLADDWEAMDNEAHKKVTKFLASGSLPGALTSATPEPDGGPRALPASVWRNGLRPDTAAGQKAKDGDE